MAGLLSLLSLLHKLLLIIFLALFQLFVRLVGNEIQRLKADAVEYQVRVGGQQREILAVVIDIALFGLERKHEAVVSNFGLVSRINDLF